MAKWLGRKLERVFLAGSLTGFLLLLSLQVVGNGRVKLEPNFTRDNEAKYSRRTCETGGDNTSQLRATANMTVSVSDKATGYLIAFRYYEQQTQALRNYLQFQCLGNSFGMRIVEPFIRKSFFSFPFDELLAGRNLLQLGDSIDLDLWNQQTTSKFGFPPTKRNGLIQCSLYGGDCLSIGKEQLETYNNPWRLHVNYNLWMCC